LTASFVRRLATLNSAQLTKRSFAYNYGEHVLIYVDTFPLLAV